MARIPLKDLATAPEGARPSLEAVQAKLGMVPNTVKVMANSPATVGAYVGLSGAVETGTLSRREREQIALVVAERNDCDYCLAAHTAVGKLSGLNALEIEDARRGTATATRERAILDLTGAVLAERGAVSDGLLAKVRDAGLTDGEITEVVTNVALHTLTNYLNRLAGTEVDFPAATPLETPAGRTA